MSTCAQSRDHRSMNWKLSASGLYADTIWSGYFEDLRCMYRAIIDRFSNERLLYIYTYTLYMYVAYTIRLFWLVVKARFKPNQNRTFKLFTTNFEIAIILVFHVFIFMFFNQNLDVSFFMSFEIIYFWPFAVHVQFVIFNTIFKKYFFINIKH